jgi:drug/metabolite transporter (DMT)-like permease
MIGVVTILHHGDFSALTNIEFNRGDILFTTALAIFGLYTALTQKRPAIHSMSFIVFTFGCGALCLLPLFIWELLSRPLPQFNAANLASLAYVAVFPSGLAYICYNRGIQLIGANRSAPFFHMIPVFGSAMAIFFLGEQLHIFHIFGYALVLVGIFVAARKPRQVETPAELP